MCCNGPECYFHEGTQFLIGLVEFYNQQKSRFQQIPRIKSGPWKQVKNIANSLFTPSASSAAGIQLQLLEKVDRKSFKSIFVFSVLIQ